MRHSTPQIVFLATALSIAGCSRSGFYQAGRSAEQCESDIRQCISGTIASAGLPPATLTDFCMEAKGYEYLDSSTAAKNATRIRVTTSYGDFWAIDGGVTTLNHISAMAVENSQDSSDEISSGKLIGYRARLGENSKHTFTPVYEKDLAEETDHPKMVADKK